MITQEQLTYYVNLVSTMRMHQNRFFKGDKASLKAAKNAEEQVDSYTKFVKKEIGISEPAPLQDNKLF